VKYFSGQPMPSNVAEALKLVGKVGFITRDLWRDFFATGNSRWSREHIRLLSERHLLEQHPNPIAKNCFVASRLARILLAKHSLHYGPAPYVSQLVHDEVIVRSLLRLSRENIIHDWRVENEMKSIQMRQHQLNSSAKEQKYPDAVFKLSALNRQRLCAMEYERTRKSPQRYRDILWLYSKMDSLWMVLFVCETETIHSMIKRQLHHLGQPLLNNRVAFTNAELWKKAPGSAPIELADKSFTLNQLCSVSENIAA